MSDFKWLEDVLHEAFRHEGQEELGRRIMDVVKAAEKFRKANHETGSSFPPWDPFRVLSDLQAAKDEL